MSFLHRNPTVSQNTPVISSMQIQTSCFGRAVPWVFGKNRVPPNIIQYDDFTSIPHNDSSAAGNKGGSAPSSISFTYTAAVIMAICRGEIDSIGKVWKGSEITTTSALGLDVYTGSATQTAYPYFVTKHPTKALPYPGIAYTASGSYDLGTSASLDNHNYEVQMTGAVGGGVPDANVADVIKAILTDQQQGLGFSTDKVGDLTQFSNFCLANGIWVSPAYQEQTAAYDCIKNLLQIGFADCFYSGGKFCVATYSDQSASNSHATYTPTIAPVYALTEDDFLGDSETDAIQCIPKALSETYNRVQVSFKDRANDYNDNIVEWKDESDIDQYGLRSMDTVDLKEICDASVAQKVVNFIGHRSLYVRNTYKFKLPWKYLALEPMDLVELYYPRKDLNGTVVLITKISESEDDNGLDIEAEEFNLGTHKFTLKPPTTLDGFTPNWAVDPGNSTNPVIFEAPLQLTNNDPQVWLATAGGANWGGCEVWASKDNATYQRIGVMQGKSRYGSLTAVLATGAAVDTLNTLAVDMSAAGGALSSGTQQNALDLVTGIYIDGEFGAYKTATLTGVNRYSITYIVRGAYGSDITSHAIGSSFVRMDDGLFKFSYPKDWLGKTIYIKLVSFNSFGGARQDISAVSSYTYTIAGAPVGVVQNLRLDQPWLGDDAKISWDLLDGTKSYDVEVDSGSTGTVLRSVTGLTNPRYVYTFDEQVADGAFYRYLVFKVRGRSPTGRAGAWNSVVATNPQVAALTGIQVDSGIKTAFFRCDKPTDGDFEGIIVWMSTTSSFTPSDSNKVYDGIGTVVTITKLTGGTALAGGTTYYIKAAGYDSFGKDSLNISSSVAVLVSANAPDTNTINASMIQNGILDITKFASGIQPVGIYSGLPTVSGYTGSTVITNTIDGKLYRLVSGAWTAVVPATDISGQIISSQLTDASITSAKIASNAVGLAALADGAVSAAKTNIAAISPTTGALTPNSVGSSQILTSAVTSTQIAANAVTAAKTSIAAIDSSTGGLTANSVGSAQILSNAVTATQIAANAVTAAKTSIAAINASTGALTANSVTSTQIVAGSIVSSNIAASTITGSNIAANTIGATNIAASAITADKLAIGSTTFDNLQVFGNGTDIGGNWGVYLNGVNQFSGTARGHNLVVFNRSTHAFYAAANYDTYGSSSECTRLANDLNGLSSSYIICLYSYDAIGTNSNLIAALKRCGDSSSCENQSGRTPYAFIGTFNIGEGRGISQLNPSGTSSNPAIIQSMWIGTTLSGMGDSITPFTIIEGGRLRTGSITTNQIAAGTIVAGNIAAGTITGSNIAATTIGASNIVSGSITSVQIAAATITAGNIAAGTITATQLAVDSVTASQIQAGAVGATEIAAGAITASKLAVTSLGMALNSDPNFADSNYWINSTGTLLFSTGGGGGYVSSTFGYASGGANVWAYSSELMSINPSSVYKMSGYIYLDTGNRQGYFAVLFYDQAGNSIGSNGWGGSWSGYAWSGVPPTAQWSYQYGLFGAGTGKTIPGNATSFRIGVILNYSGTSGSVMAVQSLRVEEVLGSTLIQDGAITTSKIVAGAITATQIAAATITGSNIAANTISTGNLQANSITTALIAAGAINTAQLAAGAITASRLAINSIGSALNLDPNFLDAGFWTNVSGALLFASNAGGNAVSPYYAYTNNGNYVDAYANQLISIDDSRTYRLSAQVYTDSGNNKVFYGYVNFYNSAGTFLTTSWGGSYSGYPISSYTPTGGTWSYVYGLFGASATNQIPSNATYCRIGVLLNYGGSSSTVMAVQALRLEEVIGTTLIQDGAITTAKIVAGAVTADRILSNSITSTQIAANTIVAGNIAAGTITATQIAAATITGAKIAANTIAASNIVSNTITASQIASGTITASQIASNTITASNILTNTLTADLIVSNSATEFTYYEASISNGSTTTLTFPNRNSGIVMVNAYCNTHTGTSDFSSATISFHMTYTDPSGTSHTVGRSTNLGQVADVPTSFESFKVNISGNNTFTVTVNVTVGSGSPGPHFLWVQCFSSYR